MRRSDIQPHQAVIPAIILVITASLVGMVNHSRHTDKETVTCTDGKLVRTWTGIDRADVHTVTIIHTDENCKVVDGTIYSIKELK